MGTSSGPFSHSLHYPVDNIIHNAARSLPSVSSSTAGAFMYVKSFHMNNVLVLMLSHELRAMWAVWLEYLGVIVELAHPCCHAK